MAPAVLRSPEPVAGYTLRQRIGTGGYGEVWKADAPGGLVKAIKFVFGCMDEQRAVCEMKALTRIKEVRHPFLLSLERIEVVDGQLVIITELADQSIKDRFEECKKQGLPGIPRDELLVYLRDAADALDYMSEHYSLQHLDVKPENLLILGGRVKVADFGLVKDIHDATVSLMGGLTPVYASPEVYEGRPSLHSDQYSLAIVYQEMLTGVLPFPGRTPAQLAAQHLNARPRLGSLSEEDRPLIARALAKDPVERFPNCRALVEALLHPGVPPPAVSRDRGPAVAKRVEESDSAAVQGQPTQTCVADSDAIRSGLAALRPRADKPEARPSRAGDSGISPTQTFAGPAEAASPGRRQADTAAPEAAPQDDPLAPSPSAAAAAIDLGPLDVGPQDATFRPTLFIGLGGLAGRVLRQLRGRLHDRFGRADALPAVQMVLIDTDPRACAQATQGDENTALRHADILAAPLRPTHEYRAASGKLLGWLSRRWLYNIPRSLQTEGIRPLGRLALADHAPAILKRIREALQEISAPQAVAASAKALGMEPAAGPPQVFIVASACGGTGGGMAADVGYAVRDLLAEIGDGEAGDGIYGVLVYGTGRGPNEKQIAAANAYAVLGELEHYAAAGYPGDSALGLPAFPARTPAFDETCVVHLGDDLDEGDFESGIDQLGEYLFLHTATTATAFFAGCRAEAVGRLQRTGRMDLRTFGLRQVGNSQSGGIGPAVQFVCKSVIERWLGRAETPRPARSDSQAPDSPRLLPAGAAADPAPKPSEADLEIEQHSERIGIGRDAFIEIAREVVAVQLGCEPDDFIRGLFDQFLQQQQRAPAPDATAWARTLLESIHAVLGVTGEADDGGTPGRDSVQAAIEEPVRRLASPRAEAACGWILKRVDDREAGLGRARQAAGWLVARLRAIEVEIGGAVQQFQDAAATMQRALLDPASSDRVQLRAWLSLRRPRRQGPRIDERWADYGRLRVEQMVLSAAVLLARAVRAQVAQAGDRLADLQRELTHLAGQFEVPAGWGQHRRELRLAPEDEAAQQIARALRAAAPGMADVLEQQIRQSLLVPHGGLCGLLKHGAALRPRLLRTLRAEARTAVSKSLNEIRVAGALSARAEEDDDHRPFLECFEEARPRLLDCGGSRRVLVLCPEDAVESARRETAQAGLKPPPTVLPDAGGSLLLCHEVAGISLARAAAEIIEDRRDLAEMASRLHTRVDVTWRRLAGGA